MRGVPERSGAPCFLFRRQAGFTLVELMITVGDRRHSGDGRDPELHEVPRESQDFRGQGQSGRHPRDRARLFLRVQPLCRQPAVHSRPDRQPAGRLPWADDTRFSILGYAPDGKVFFSYGLAGVDTPTDNFTAGRHPTSTATAHWSIWHLTGGDKEMYHEGADL